MIEQFITYRSKRKIVTTEHNNLLAGYGDNNLSMVYKGIKSK